MTKTLISLQVIRKKHILMLYILFSLAYIDIEGNILKLAIKFF